MMILYQSKAVCQGTEELLWDGKPVPALKGVAWHFQQENLERLRGKNLA
jgi:hypothetical protein